MTLADEVVRVVRDVFGAQLIGAYLHGSAALGGLRAASDIDVFAVLARHTTSAERRELVDRLLEISGARARRGPARPVELTIVAQSDVCPWVYPARSEFQYGEWLRDEFELGVTPSPAPSPDLAPLITMVMQANHPLIGPPPADLLDPVPHADLRRAIVEGLPGLLADLDGDTRNVVLTLARVWLTLVTGEIRSKAAAADWALGRLPAEHRAVLAHARSAYLGDEPDRWDDLRPHIRPHVDYVIAQIEQAAPKEHIARSFSLTSETHERLSLFDHFGQQLVDWARLKPGNHVLDVATGTGASLLPAARQVGPDGWVVGVDLAAGMVDRLRATIRKRRIANATALVGDAEALPFRDESFDAVISGFSLFFFPDTQRALAEFRRVLRPGGTLAVSTFTRHGSRSIDRIWRMLAGHMPVPSPAEDERRFDQPAALIGALTAGGFDKIEIDESPYEVVLDDFDAWWDWIRSMEFREHLERMNAEALERFRASAREQLGRQPEAPQVRFPMDALFARGLRPELLRATA